MTKTEHRPLGDSGSLLAFAAMILVVPLSASAQGIIGLPMEAVDDNPGVMEIFARTPEAPVIMPGETFELGEILVRFNLDLSDDNVEMLALSLGATSVERLSPIGLFLVRGTPTVEATESSAGAGSTPTKPF